MKRTTASRTGRTRRIALVAAAAALLSSCGHSSDSGSATTAAPATTTTGAANSAPGTFGSLNHVCGPGTSTGGSAAPGTSVRGVTASDIQIGVLNDATSSLDPGLGKQYPVVAKAFAKWCNAAGGINGRKIKIVDRDAQITQSAARVIEACQSDFMLVGGGTPLDAATVQPRVACGLGSIPAYTASDEATHSTLQALPTRIAGKEVNVALYRLLESTYGKALQKIGLLAVDSPSLLQPAQRTATGLGKAGGTVVSFQKVPLQVDSWRTYVQPLVGKVEALVPAPGDDTALFQAMNDVGYEPTLMIDPIGNTYTSATTKALKAAPISAPFYLTTGVYPLEMRAQNPATQQAWDLTLAAGGTKDDVDVTAWSAWLLFAKSATACGSTLTVSCVISHAKSQRAFTGGGLTAPVDIGDVDSIGACRAVLKATKSGFTYDKSVTKPTKGIFNCDPRNVVTLSDR